MPFAVAAYITAAYWFTASTSFANPAVTLARAASDTFAGIRPLDVPAFIAAQLVGAAAATALFAWLVPIAPEEESPSSPTAPARLERRAAGGAGTRRVRAPATLRLGHRGHPLRVETITWGIIFYGFPVFLRAMEGDLGASRVVVTGASRWGSGSPRWPACPWGRWLDRHGARLLMTLGSTLAAGLTFLWSMVETPAALYAVWALMGIAMATTLYEPAFAAVVQWFPTGRDRALLTVTIAAGFASTIFMPIEAWLLASVGWRQALVILAAVLAVTTIPLTPSCCGRRRTLRSRAGRAGRPRATPGLSLGAALRHPIFWILAAGSS